MEEIKMTKGMADEVKAIIDLADGVVTAKEEAKVGFSNAQESFAKRCASASIDYSESQFEAICAGIIGKDAKGKPTRKQKATDARHWGDPKIAPKIDALFTIAAAKSGGKSVYGFARSMGSQLKEGHATSPTGAAKNVTAAVQAVKDKAATPDGAKLKAKKSATHHLKAGGYCDDDIVAVLAAIKALGVPTTPAEPVTTEPEAPTPDVQVADALAKVSDPAVDEELGALLAGLLQAGIDPVKAAATAKATMALMSH
jgi:hypothetical protein